MWIDRFPRVKRRLRPLAIARERADKLPYRVRAGLSYLSPQLRRFASWSLHSREVSNFTYDLDPLNEEYLASTIAAVTGCEAAQALSYIRELSSDVDLREAVVSKTMASKQRGVSDPVCKFGRRVGWYAFARILKPKIIVETGVDKGLGAVALCRALEHNASEGYLGHYYGTDIEPSAGWLLDSEYGTILRGDSIESLRGLSDVDLFINDSDHSADYEAREYEVMATRMAPGGVLLGDNSHLTRELLDFSLAHGRRFLFWSEKPKDHWYPGAGIGVSFT